MRISKRFKLGKSQYELDFVDVDTNRDKRVFIDPALIGRYSDPWARDVTDTIGSFFHYLVRLLRAGKTQDALTLFENLGEPNETCLGMSLGKPEGRGVGPADTRKIFDSISSSRAIRTGLVTDLEDCVIFVENFGPDKLSDMTTNIIRKHLIEYTKDQCKLLGIPLQAGVSTGKIWNKADRRWEDNFDQMLLIGPKKILLVPKRIVSINGVYAADAYHQMDVLEFLKHENLSLKSALVQFRAPKGKHRGAAYVTKKSLKEEGGAAFSKEFLTDFSLAHRDVLTNYKVRAKEKSVEISNESLDASADVGAICSALLEELNEIKPGREAATAYHKLITGVLELLFYPNLVQPKEEVQIDDGRKRIDIVFNNSAAKGFFSLAPQKFGIPAPLISIECKNYASDPKNPELDQLAGRFSPQKGKLGLLLCRSVSQYELLIQRCSDHWKGQRGLIVPLFDSDIKKILTEIQNGNPNTIDTLLQDRAYEIAIIS